MRQAERASATAYGALDAVWSPSPTETLHERALEPFAALLVAPGSHLRSVECELHASQWSVSETPSTASIFVFSRQRRPRRVLEKAAMGRQRERGNEEGSRTLVYGCPSGASSDVADRPGA